MKNYFKKLLIQWSGNDRFQRLLAKNVEFSQYLMGIGSGTDVAASGEKVIVQKLRQQYAKAGSPLCVFDVGANQGQFLHLMQAGLQGIPAVFHAFEPGKGTFQILVEKTRGFTNLQLNNCALGNRNAAVELYYNEPGSGLASLSKRRLEHFGIKFELAETVQLMTLDEYCVQNAIEKIDLLKLDVEGHEFDVLQGSVETFRSNKVQALTFEFGGSNIDSRTYFQDFWYLLQEYRMKSVFRITPSGYLARIREYREIDEQFRTTNYFVSREEM